MEASSPKEVPDDGLNHIPTDKHIDILVTDVLKANGTSELIDKPDDVDDNSRCRQALGAHSRLQCFSWNDTL